MRFLTFGGGALGVPSWDAGLLFFHDDTDGEFENSGILQTIWMPIQSGIVQEAFWEFGFADLCLFLWKKFIITE